MNRRRGYTLIEMMIAVSLLSVAGGLVFQLSQAGQLSRRTLESAAAVNALENKMEEMLACRTRGCVGRIAQASTGTVGIGAFDIKSRVLNGPDGTLRVVLEAHDHGIAPVKLEALLQVGR